MDMEAWEILAVSAICQSLFLGPYILWLWFTSVDWRPYKRRYWEWKLQKSKTCAKIMKTRTRRSNVPSGRYARRGPRGGWTRQ